MRKMDDTEDDARYPHKPYYVNNYSSSHRPKPPLYPHPAVDQYDDDDQDEDDEFEENEEENHEDDVGYRNGYRHVIEEDGDFERHPKKRKLKNLASGYEFAPRMVAAPGGVKLSNSGSDWSDNETFVLLDAWGDRFLQLGRKSLRSEDWHDVAEKVSEIIKAQKTEGQCRNRLDSLKKKYRKEKDRVEEMGMNSSKWMFFKKMDMLMGPPQRQESGLACGVDSGEYVFMNPRVYLDRSNGLDEMRDSPEESETEEDDDDGDSDGLPPSRVGGNSGEDSASFRLLANSIQKFGEIYEKIESSKRQQMMELERMRLDFNRELELQKKHILERAQAEIAKIQEDDDDDDDEDTDTSAENLSG